MTQLEIVRTDFLHIREICETMRDRERLAFAAAKMDPEKALTHEVASSLLCYSGVIDGECIAIGGVKSAGVLSDEAYIWLICGRQIDRLPTAFLRGAQRGLREVEPYFKRIYGLVCVDFYRSKRFLEWIGFQIDPPKNGVSLFWRGGRPIECGSEILTAGLIRSSF